MKTITKKQSAVLEFLRTYISQTGRPPTVYEISFAFGWASDNAAQTHLNALQKKGFIQLGRGMARGISIVGESKKDTEKMARALRVIVTWANYDAGAGGCVVLTPKNVLALCNEALA